MRRSARPRASSSGVPRPARRRTIHRAPPQDSTAIEDAGYDAARRELYIRYTGGAAYTYLAVPLSDYVALTEAESRGGFVNTRIKPRYEVREGAPI
jgi:hypothetical protein